MQDAILVRQEIDRCRGDGQREVVVGVVACGPGHFREAGEDRALVVGPGYAAVVLAGERVGDVVGAEAVV